VYFRGRILPVSVTQRLNMCGLVKGTSAGVGVCCFVSGVVIDGRKVRSGEGWSAGRGCQPAFSRDAGPVLRLRLAVTARLLLEAQGGIMLPLHRPSFEIMDMGSSMTAYSVPRLGASAGIGVAYRFR